MPYITSIGLDEKKIHHIMEGTVSNTDIDMECQNFVHTALMLRQ